MAVPVFNTFIQLYDNRTRYLYEQFPSYMLKFNTPRLGDRICPRLQAWSKTESSDHQYRLRTVAKTSVFWTTISTMTRNVFRVSKLTAKVFKTVMENMSYWLSRLQSVFIENVHDYDVIIFCTDKSKPKDGNRSCRRKTVCSINFKKLYTMENVQTVNEFKYYIIFFSAQHVRKKRS